RTSYVSTAGKTTYLTPDSMLMCHGAAYQRSLEEQVKSFGEKGSAALAAWKKREDAFFQTIHVNQAITTYGQIQSERSEAGPFDYSIEDLAKFGVTNIIQKGGAWRWRELRPKFASAISRVPVHLPASNP